MCDRCGSPTAWPVARCRECSGRTLGFDDARSAVAYHGPARVLVRSWKERGLRHASSLAVEFVEAHVPRPAADVITYIPPDSGRQLQRSRHPAECLARELARRWGLELTSLLARTGARPRQAGLSRVERRRNAGGAFAATGMPPSTVVLVDDVYTTGATASAAAAVLRSAGAARIHVVTFARAVR